MAIDPTPTPVANEFLVNTVFNGAQSQATIARLPPSASLPDGGFVVVWTSVGPGLTPALPGGSFQDIHAQLYDAAGNPVGVEFRVNTFVLAQQLSPAVASLPPSASLADGGFVVTWSTFTPFGISGQRFDATGAPVGTEFHVQQDFDTDNGRQNSTVTALDGGGFLVTWTALKQDGPTGVIDGSGAAVLGRIYDATGVAVTDEFLLNTTTANAQNFSSATALPGGGFVATWVSFNQDGSSDGIFGQRFDAAGAKVGAEFPVNAVTAFQQQFPSMTALADGGFVVTWTSFVDNTVHFEVVGRIFDAAGNPAGGEFRINASTPVSVLDTQNLSSVTALADGGFLVVWQSRQQDGSATFGVFAQRFDATGAKLGIEFQINQTVAGNQGFEEGGGDYSVVQLASGDVMIVWQSGPDASGFTDVYARRFALPDAVVNDGAGVATITGTPVEDQTLAASLGPDPDGPASNVVHQWLRNGAEIVGATDATYTLGDADVGAQISVRLGYTDGQGFSETVVSAATPAVGNVNDAPMAVDDPAATVEDQPVAIAAASLVANDTDAEGDTLSLTAVGNAIGGTVALVDGTVTFTPTPDFNGTASFDYTVSDGNSGSDAGTVTVAVGALNDAPIIAGGPAVSLSIPENTTFVTTILADDIDGDPLTYQLVGGAADRFTIDSVTHEIRFQSPPDFDNPGPSSNNGVFTFDVQVTDGNGGFASQAIEVTLTDLNEAPTEVFVPASKQVPVGHVVSGPVRLGRIDIVDDQLGTNHLSLAGADADKFTLVAENGATFLTLLPAATASFAAPYTLSVTVNVDDPALGGPVDATATYSLSSIAVGPNDFLPLVAPQVQQSRVVSYSFEFGSIPPVGGSGPGVPFTPADQQAVREALAAWDDISGLIFVEVPRGQGDLRLYVSALSAGLAGATNFPVGQVTNVAVDPTYRTNFELWAHEIGHAIGLLHAHPEEVPGAVFPGVDPRFNSVDFTVMSYAQGIDGSGAFTQTSIGPLDRDAAHFLYGGPDLGTYTFDPATLAFHYVGTDAADAIFGNRSFGNVLEGGAGDDVLNGAGFSNRLIGGAGNDELRSQAGGPAPAFTAVYSGGLADYAFEFVSDPLGTIPAFLQVTDLRATSPDGVDRVFGLNFLFEFAGEATANGPLLGFGPTDIEFTVNGVNPVASFSIAENADGLLGQILRVTIEPPPGLPELPLRSVALADSANGKFALAGFELSVIGNLDFEQAAFHDIVVRAVDGYGVSYEETVRIHVIDVPGQTIVGTEGDDDDIQSPSLFGADENDTILALGGNDQIFQSRGSDTIDGGAGSDTFNLGLNLADYALAQSADGSVSFSYNVEIPGFGRISGTDTLWNVESFVFADGTMKTFSELFNDAPVANPDAGAAGENETKSFDVLGNDTDPDVGDTKTLVSIGAVAVSSLNAAVNGIIAASAFSIVGGQIQFSPGVLFDLLGGGETATVEVHYTMRDAAGVTSSSTLTLTINGAAEGPVYNVINGTPGDNRNLNGTAGADQINGLAGNDWIDAKGGDDLIVAGAGQDMVRAGGGNDTVMATIGDGNDLYIGESGSDTFDFSQTSAPATVSLGTTILGFTSNGAGFATSTQIGTDVLLGFENAIGGSGNDAITGGNLANILRGGGGDDTIFGLRGNDSLAGDAGNDRLIGGQASDQMTGGLDADMFVFLVAESRAGDIDTINDFVVGQDHLQFQGLAVTQMAELDVNGDSVLDTSLTLNDGAVIRLLSVSGVSQWDVLL